MTNPKDKAMEIVEMFTFNCRECDNAVLCAIIYVDGMIQEASTFMSSKVQCMNYWQEVLQELKPR